MAKIRRCDFCGIDMPQDNGFSVSIFSMKTDKDIYEADACTKCAARARRALEFIKVAAAKLGKRG